MHRSPLRDPKPIPAQEALGSDFPSSSSQAEPAMGSCFCSHTVKTTGEMIRQKTNPATKSGVSGCIHQKKGLEMLKLESLLKKNPVIAQNQL